MSASLPPHGGQSNLTVYPVFNDDILDVTVRFSSSLPDLPLTFLVSSSPNIASLKQRIRQHLVQESQSKTLRLIHNGKLLANETLLRSLRPRSHPPTRVSTPQPPSAHAQHTTTGQQDSTGPYETDRLDAKGKTAVRSQNTSTERGTNGTIWIHCAIGLEDQSPTESEKETLLAARQEQKRADSRAASDLGLDSDAGDNNNDLQDSSTITSAPAPAPGPRGFDRLLDTGFSPSDIQSLRLQFLAVHSHTHTPDTMPTPEEMRLLEDRWLDNTTTSTLASDSPANTNTNNSTQDEAARFLDDSIYGTIMGFIWPIGCLIWGLREEGIMTPSRKVAVVLGIMLNLGLGFVKFGG